MNIIVAIGLYLLKSFHYSTLALHAIPVHCWNHIMCHIMGCFILFLSDDRKKDYATTATHSKCIIEMFQNCKVLFSKISTIWENTGVCTDQYQCVTALYLLSMLSHTYNIITDCGVGSSGHEREVVGVLNSINRGLFKCLRQLYNCLVHPLITHKRKFIPQQWTHKSV